MSASLMRWFEKMLEYLADPFWRPRILKLARTYLLLGEDWQVPLSKRT
jgi:hypothetical protein